MARTVTGTVVSNRADKTITIKVDRRKTHPIYRKQYTVSNKFAAHDQDNEASIGDKVEIVQIRPVSKTKRWKLVKILVKGKKLRGEE